MTSIYEFNLEHLETPEKKKAKEEKPKSSIISTQE